MREETDFVSCVESSLRVLPPASLAIPSQEIREGHNWMELIFISESIPLWQKFHLEPRS
jgi:hypothetical protein